MLSYHHTGAHRTGAHLMKSILQLERLGARDLPSTSQYIYLGYMPSEVTTSTEPNSPETTTPVGNTGSNQSQGSSSAAAIQAEIDELTKWIDAFKESNRRLELEKQAWVDKLKVQAVAVITEAQAYNAALLVSNAATKARQDFEKLWENRSKNTEYLEGIRDLTNAENAAIAVTNGAKASYDRQLALYSNMNQRIKYLDDAIAENIKQIAIIQQRIGQLKLDLDAGKAYDGQPITINSPGYGDMTGPGWTDWTKPLDPKVYVITLKVVPLK